MAKTKKKYFPRHDDLSKEQAISQTAADFLNWMADEEEKKGNKENAERLRGEAKKAKEA